jgi:hypothetical protein
MIVDAFMDQEKSVPVPDGIAIQAMMRPSDYLLNKQINGLIQFGYVTMFVTVVPSAPFFALVNNMIEMRLDIQCSVEVKRRPVFDNHANEVSALMSILEFMTFAAVTVNCALLYLNQDMDTYVRALFPLDLRPHDNVHATNSPSSVEDEVGMGIYKLWCVLALEHLLLGLKAMLAITIPDTPAWVEKRYRDLSRNTLMRHSGHNMMATVTSSNHASLEAAMMPVEEEMLDEEESRRCRHRHLQSDDLEPRLSMHAVQATRIAALEAQAILDAHERQALKKQVELIAAQRDKAVLAMKHDPSVAPTIALPSEKKDASNQQMRLPSTIMNDNDIKHDPRMTQADATKVATITTTDAAAAWKEERKSQSDLQETYHPCIFCMKLHHTHVQSKWKCIDCQVYLCQACDETLHPTCYTLAGLPGNHMRLEWAKHNEPTSKRRVRLHQSWKETDQDHDRDGNDENMVKEVKVPRKEKQNDHRTRRVQQIQELLRGVTTAKNEKDGGTGHVEMETILDKNKDAILANDDEDHHHDHEEVKETSTFIQEDRLVQEKQVSPVLGTATTFAKEDKHVQALLAPYRSSDLEARTVLATYLRNQKNQSVASIPGRNTSAI